MYSEDGDVVEEAACIVARVARSSVEAHCDAIVAAGCVPLAVKLLPEESSFPLPAFSLVLHHLAASSAANRAAIVAAGCIPALVAFLSDESAVINHATMALTHFAAHSAAHADAIVEAGGFQKSLVLSDRHVPGSCLTWQPAALRTAMPSSRLDVSLRW